jgi:hypothetical protein
MGPFSALTCAGAVAVTGATAVASGRLGQGAPSVWGVSVPSFVPVGAAVGACAGADCASVGAGLACPAISRASVSRKTNDDVAYNTDLVRNTTFLPCGNERVVYPNSDQRAHAPAGPVCTLASEPSASTANRGFLPSAAKRYNAFEVSCNAKITVRKHSSREHTAMNLLKRLWQWYSTRRTERRMLKGHGVYRTQTNQSHLPEKKMPTLPISTSA